MKIFKSIKSIFIKLFLTGVDENSTIDLSKRVILTNQISLILILGSFPYIGIFYFMDRPIVSISLFVVELFFLSSIVLNKFKYYLLSRLFLILFSNFVTFLYASYFRESAGIQFLFFAYVGIPLVLFHFDEIKKIAIGILIPILCFLLIYSLKFNLLPDANLTLFQSSIIFYTVSCVSFLIIILYIKFMIDAHKQYDKKLQMSHDDLKKAYESLKESRSAAEELALQSAYATLTRGIAHEIKNPLQILSGRAYLVLEDLDNKESVKKFAEVIMRNIERLTKLIHSMLDYGASSGRDKENFCICKVVDDIVELSTHNAKQKGISIAGHWTDSLQVCGNKVFIYQALLNLVVNAIQYTPRGGAITLTCTRKTIADKENNTRDEVEISVSDTGVGISEENMKQIFVPYFTSKVQPENTGLGLSMAFKTVAENDGRLEVKSEVGVGTTFLVYLPLVDVIA